MQQIKVRSIRVHHLEAASMCRMMMLVSSADIEMIALCDLIAYNSGRKAVDVYGVAG